MFQASRTNCTFMLFSKSFLQKSRFEQYRFIQKMFFYKIKYLFHIILSIQI